MTWHNKNQHRKRSMKRALGFTICKNRWKGRMRRIMQKFVNQQKKYGNDISYVMNTTPEWDGLRKLSSYGTPVPWPNKRYIK